MKAVVPAPLAVVFILLHFNLRSMGETALVMPALPCALPGGMRSSTILMAVVCPASCSRWK